MAACRMSMRQKREARKETNSERSRKEEALNKRIITALYTCHRLGKTNEREVKEAKKKWKAAMKRVRKEDKKIQF